MRSQATRQLWLKYYDIKSSLTDKEREDWLSRLQMVDLKDYTLLTKECDAYLMEYDGISIGDYIETDGKYTCGIVNSILHITDCYSLKEQKDVKCDVIEITFYHRGIDGGHVDYSFKMNSEYEREGIRVISKERFDLLCSIPQIFLDRNEEQSFKKERSNYSGKWEYRYDWKGFQKNLNHYIKGEPEGMSCLKISKNHGKGIIEFEDGSLWKCKKIFNYSLIGRNKVQTRFKSTKTKNFHKYYYKPIYKIQ